MVQLAQRFSLTQEAGHDVRVAGDGLRLEGLDGDGLAGLEVYAFDGTTYTGFNKTTDSSGEALFTLPQGSYRFRADFNGTQFWSGDANHCDIPGCETATVTVTKPVTVTVQDSAGITWSVTRFIAEPP